MKLRKIRQILDLGSVRLPGNCVSHAQSPQPVVIVYFVRVFFSTRQIDVHGEPVSVVSFADFEPNFSKMLNPPSRICLHAGTIGCFDEHGVFPLSVLKCGTELWGYSSGWSRRKSVDVETAIGFTKSMDNGCSFERVGKGPILNASLGEPFLVGDGFVLNEKSLFHMWYIFGTNWKVYEKGGSPERTYKIGHAISSDGVSWVKTSEGRQIIPDALGPTECQALPCVAFFQGLYHMFFCYRESSAFRKDPSRAYRIGHAVSSDLLAWTRDEPIEFSGEHQAWDSEMMCYPGVVNVDGRVFLLYNGNNFGRDGFGVAELEQA